MRLNYPDTWNYEMCIYLSFSKKCLTYIIVHFLQLVIFSSPKQDIEWITTCLAQAEIIFISVGVFPNMNIAVVFCVRVPWRSILYFDVVLVIFIFVILFVIQGHWNYISLELEYLFALMSYSLELFSDLSPDI